MGVRRPAYVAVADHLREMILAGALPAGERLPTEAELGAQFGVSRSTIREALKMLSSIRLVATSRGVSGGSMVTVGNPDDVSKLLQVGITQLTAAEKCTVDELLQTRELLEVRPHGSPLSFGPRRRSIACQRRSRAHWPTPTAGSCSN